MVVPTSEVGYTSATTRRETTKSVADVWWHWILKKNYANCESVYLFYSNPVFKQTIDIHIYYTAMYNTVNSSPSLPVSAYIQAIITPMHYLDLTEKPYSSTHINLGGERSHSLDTNVIKPVKTLQNWTKKQLYIKDKNILQNFNTECRQYNIPCSIQCTVQPQVPVRCR
jgi:hypothetical protein